MMNEFMPRYVLCAVTVEENTASTEVRTGKGVDELLKATTHQKKSRSKMTWLLLVLLLICGGVIFYLFVLNPDFKIT